MAVGVQAQSPAPDPQVVATFTAATTDYASMHRRLEQGVGTFDVNTPIDSINRMIHELAAAIRSERPDARMGDLFTQELGNQLRARVSAALGQNGLTAYDVYLSQHVDGIDPFTVRLRVNDTFPWILGAAMFPCLIEALPPLPPELQYRIVGSDLVLIDVHASLIVDILPNVVTDSTFRMFH